MRLPLTPLACLAFWLAAPISAAGQAAQNPSPMVEHTRSHLRLNEEKPSGRREPLEIGTLFLPENLRLRGPVPLLVHFHGSTWLPEVAAARSGTMAVLTVQLGSGSSVYARPFSDPNRFGGLLKQAEEKAGARFDPVTLSAWSAGYGAVREILNVPEYYQRVRGVLLLDALHTGYPSGKPGPGESRIETEPVQVFLQFARDATNGRKAMLVTHTEVFPGTFASTTETADYLLKQLGLQRSAVLQWGPMGTQQLSEARKGRFVLLGFAGNSAPDHVDQLHALPDFLKILRPE